MHRLIATQELTRLGLQNNEALVFQETIQQLIENSNSSENAWLAIANYLSTHHYPFEIHLYLYTLIYPDWESHPERAPACIPSLAQIKKSNLYRFMQEFNQTDVALFHQWSTQHYVEFWLAIIKKLHISFKKSPDTICNLDAGLTQPVWLKGAKLNIADSCLQADPHKTAIIYPDHHQKLAIVSYDELNRLSNRVANGLIQLGIKAKDKVAIIMPMNANAVAIYLGILKVGAIIVSIADSFAKDAIAERLQITQPKVVFTQDCILWGTKKRPLYEKIQAIDALFFRTIVLSHANSSMPFNPRDRSLSHALPSMSLNSKDLSWETFLSDDDQFESVPCHPMDACQILFSSGTTGTPKAIIWNHTTPIKAASDGYFHHDIHHDDIAAWPTNLGWMMGPWLLFATLINQATLALSPDIMKERPFGEFIADAKVTILGVTPTLVAYWRQTRCMENLDWHAIRLFSSTGECSNPKDMLYLMSLAGYKPVIEYCGGTEIGGAYVTSTIIQKNYPSLFSTPAMGINFTIINPETGDEMKEGDVAIIPPSIGLSTELLNGNHDQIYYGNMFTLKKEVPLVAHGNHLDDEKMPASKKEVPLRRHGDHLKQLDNGYFLMLGRSDDTMNLGGIKVSAAEIERAIMPLPDIAEIAAIAVPCEQHGPDQLIIYAQTELALDKTETLRMMQAKINLHLNAFFKIHDLIFLKELPKTPSNKILRRSLRDQFPSRFARGSSS